MSTDTVLTPADILIQSVIKTTGKREFLKAVERLFPTKAAKARKAYVRRDAPSQENQCLARVKGARTGKDGRRVQYMVAQCTRHKNDGGLCKVHQNQMIKFGALLYGLVTDPIDEDLEAIFGKA
jgi:hypothetical protein